MILRCPCCMGEIQSESKLNAGQHVICPLCDNKFIYYPQKYVMPEIITSGVEFEEFICRHINNQGDMLCEQTKASGDQGVDLLVEVGGLRVAIQCKLYSSPVGNEAVQQIVAGRIMYKCDIAMVVTNSTFTRSAVELASATDVHLVNYKNIIEALEIIKATHEDNYMELERIAFMRWEEDPSLPSAMNFILTVFSCETKMEGYACSASAFKVFAFFYMDLIEIVKGISEEQFAEITTKGVYRIEIEYAAYSKWFDLASACFELAGMHKESEKTHLYACRFMDLVMREGYRGFDYPHVTPNDGIKHALMNLKKNFILDENSIKELINIYSTDKSIVMRGNDMYTPWESQILRL